MGKISNKFSNNAVLLWIEANDKIFTKSKILVSIATKACLTTLKLCPSLSGKIFVATTQVFL